MRLDNQLWWIAAAIAIVALLYFARPLDYEYIAEHPDQLGYAGIFLVMLVSNATILLPLPGLALVAALGAAPGVSPLLVGIAAGIGGGIGETTGYMFGRGSEKAIMKRDPKRYKQVRDWVERHGEMALIVLSAIPNPAFDIAGVAAGALRYEWWKFLLAVIIGNIIKCSLVAFSTGIAAYYLGLPF